MTEREQDLKKIIHEFTVWQVGLANHNKLNLQDYNLISEYTICEVLNCMFGYSLKNANSIKSNHAAVDLVDEENRIAFQITTTRSVQKIQDTLDGFTKHGLRTAYDQLFILILGQRQKSYPSLKLPVGSTFDPAMHILDFDFLLRHLNMLTNTKLSRLKVILCGNKEKPEKSTLVKAAQEQKKTLAMKKKFYKHFVDNSPRDYRTPGPFRNWFNYGSVILRNVGDRTFPGRDQQNPKWTICEFYNMYDHGVQFIRDAGYAIIDTEGNWDLLHPMQERANNKTYQQFPVWAFYHLAFENIVEFEMEPDGYHGYPTIFCHFRHDGWPFEDIRFGRMGTVHELYPTFYLDQAKRKSLS